MVLPTSQEKNNFSTQMSGQEEGHPLTIQNHLRQSRLPSSPQRVPPKAPEIDWQQYFPTRARRGAAWEGHLSKSPTVGPRRTPGAGVVIGTGYEKLIWVGDSLRPLKGVGHSRHHRRGGLLKLKVI